MSELLNTRTKTHEQSSEMCFLFWVFCCLCIGIPGHTSDLLVEFVIFDTSFLEGKRWNEISSLMRCVFVFSQWDTIGPMIFTETCCNLKFGVISVLVHG